MRTMPVLFSALAFVLTACGGASPKIDVAAEEQAVRAVSAHWLQLEQARDAAGIAALFTEDGTIYREDQEPKTGPAAIQEAITASWAKDPAATAGWTTERVDIAAAGDLAAERGKWTATGPQGQVDGGWYVTLYRKVGTEWKVVADMSISTTPAAAAVPAPAS
ncbi:MAG: DUF4440 domain-containing protein [Gemmatimonadetes bacterium]|nr:DUF4440 domain-containing protein [Gemmatimonadota bacterium]